MSRQSELPEGTNVVGLQEVVQAEEKFIEQRRAAAFPKAEVSGDGVTNNRVGLALSGGGIRSAIFNLGLLQALSHRGLLRFIDYISSVSGGGYIAGYLAAQARIPACDQGGNQGGNQGEQAKQADEGRPSFHDRPAAHLGVDPQTGRHEAGYRFGGPAKYLSDVVGWSWRYFASTSLMLLLFWSGLIAVGAGLAFLWRLLDYREVRSYLEAINLTDFGNELTIAFLPCLFLIALTGFVVVTRIVCTCGEGLFRAMTILCLTLGGLGSVLILLERQMAGWGEGGAAWPTPPLDAFSLWIVLLPLVAMAALALVFLWPSRILWRSYRDQSFPARGPLAALWLLWFSPSVVLGTAIGAGWLTGHGDWIAHFVRGLLFALVLGLQWAFYRLITRSTATEFLPRFDKVTWWLAVSVFLAAVVSLAVFLGNGEATIWANQEDVQLNQFVTWLSALVLFLQLVPLVGLDRLLRSDREEAPRWQKRIFRAVVGAALFAPAFFVVHWMARENLSEYASYRDPDLHRNDIEHGPAFIDVMRQWDQRIPVIAEDRDPTRVQGLRELKSTIGSMLQRHHTVQPGQPGGEHSISNSYAALWVAGRAVRGEQSWSRRESRPVGTWTGTVRSAALLTQHVLGVDEPPAPAGRQSDQAPVSLTAYRAAWERDERCRGEFVKKFNDELLPKSALTDVLLHEIVLQAGSSTPAADPKAPKDPNAHGPLPLRPLGAADVDRAAVRKHVQTLEKRLAENDPNEKILFLTYWRRLGQGNLPGVASNELLPGLNDVRGWPREEIAAFNRLMLEALYPDVVRPRTMVSTLIVPHRDQVVRILWLTGATAIFLLLLRCIDFNHNSPFYWFYWRRLKKYFLDRDPSGPSNASEHSEALIPLSELATCADGLPYFLFAGTLMLRRKRQDQVEPANQLFLFSKLYCGTAETGYRSTADYQVYDEHPAGESVGEDQQTRGHLRLADAVTISGSAVTPFMVGDRTWLSILMTAFNLRLGQWLLNPRRETHQPKRRWLPAVSPWTAGREYLRSFSSQRCDDWDYGFIADGGYRDFLGIEELLRRRCRLIICSDAGFNTGTQEFGDLAAMVRMARQDYGIEFLELDHDRPVDVDRFRHDVQAENRVPQQILAMRIIYPKPERQPGEQPGEKPDAKSDAKSPECLLLYIQMALTGREDVDLQQFRYQNPDFPEEPTTNQSFTASQVDSYRQLGEHIGRILCRELPPHSDAPAWDRSFNEQPLNEQPRYGDLLNEVILRLRLGYQWECFREVVYQHDDVRPEGLFAESASLNLPERGDEDPFGMVGASAEQWILRYGCDADFRNFHRRRIAEMFTAESAVPPRENGPSAGYLAVTVLALHEYIARPEVSNAPKHTDDRVDQSRLHRVHHAAGNFPGVFQVGGRQRLTNACEQWCAWWSPQRRGRWAREAEEVARTPHYEDRRAELLAVVATSVFTLDGWHVACALAFNGLQEWDAHFSPLQQRRSQVWDRLAQAARHGGAQAIRECLQCYETWEIPH